MMGNPFAVFGLTGFLLSLGMAVALCVHAVRTHQDSFWLWIILLFQPLGGLVYIFAVIVPQTFSGSAARKLGKAARETLDPGRAYREAKAAHELTPTVHNQMRLAAAAAELGRWEEAEVLYGQALQGVHEDDPALLLGRARALLELHRPAEALALLERLKAQGDAGRSPQATLAFARAYEGLGRNAEAETAYLDAEGRVPGLEGVARHAAFLARTGRREEARAALAEIDKRIGRANPHFRKEARAWRDFAASAMG
jgi:hypothetical protein